MATPQVEEESEKWQNRAFTEILLLAEIYTTVIGSVSILTVLRTSLLTCLGSLTGRETGLRKACCGISELAAVHTHTTTADSDDAVYVGGLYSKYSSTVESPQPVLLGHLNSRIS